MPLHGSAPATSWVYAYELVPPQSRDRLRALLPVLDRERAQAALEARTWQGRLVVEQQVTHILIVSDSPGLDTGATRRLEAELRRLDAGFAVTAPLPADADLPLAGSGPA